MTPSPEEFLRLSRLLNEMSFPNKLSYHVVRYKFFYDNSTKGHDCKYCRATYQLSLQGDELDKLGKLDELKGVIHGSH